MNKIALALGIGALAAGGIAAPALAQSMSWQQAKSQGLVGEQPDGYLGIVGSATAELRKIVNDVNIKRKAAYTQKAQANGATVEQFAFTTGCNLIARTDPGEMYQTPSGAWKKRGSGAPDRDPRCA
ncbi:YdbL family protein [Stakelama sp. CBK3Z-3]|uniref:YdbL family protein n=2 Tax=Stakelama flava TaxID=2860338 RepID=A0ABS6XNP6_9SPHN|nr:YdbL family protein [Stakelama flava]MBW4331848.1 YdbL family protein [Stakelama flava]